MSAPDFWREYENNVRQVYELMLRSVEADPKAVESPEYERDWWNLFESRLRIGALTYGTRLSPDECALFLDIISGERKLFKRRGRPRRDKTATLRGFHIAIFVDLLEADGWPPDAAVNHAVKIYGVARQTVYTAKKKQKRREQMLGSTPKARNMTAADRQKLIKSFELVAAAEWHPRCSRPAQKSN